MPKRTSARSGPRRKRNPDAQPAQPSIGDYLIQRLHGLGLRHVFGVPGDYVLGFLARLEESPIQLVPTTREDCAGFAADAYARMRGLGAVCVTYNVGGLNTCNAVAGAFAEKSPLVVISGAPGVAERDIDLRLHHRVGEFQTQMRVFEEITVASTILDDRLTALREIDRVLDEAMRRKGPAYIELPRDRVDEHPLHPHEASRVRPTSDRRALSEALDEAEEMLAAAEKPVILAGVEIHRYGLQDPLVKLAEQAEIAISATLLGKSVVAENHPLYIGVYEGKMGHERVREFVEDSDCILMLGCFVTDIDTGGGPSQLDPDRCIYATSEEIRIRHHQYRNVLLADFMRGLARREPRASARPDAPIASQRIEPLAPPSDAPIRVRSLFRRIDAALTEKMVVIADVGDCLFGAADLLIRGRGEFLSPAYYTSMGFAVPAALGSAFARPDLRPIVLVGDGAFQMTGTELSTIARHDLAPIVIVLNNRSYGTERLILDGPFNDLHEWRYEALPQLLGRGWGCAVRSERDLCDALDKALANTSSFSLLNVHLATDDTSPALERLARQLARRV